MFDDCIRTAGTIRKPLRPGLYEAVLRNGKTVTAHLSKELQGTVIPDDAKVTLEMTTYDFDQGRIVAVDDATA